MKVVFVVNALLAGILHPTSAFAPTKATNAPLVFKRLASSNPDDFPKNGEGNMLEGMFTGGIFDKDPDTVSSAIQIASKINSVKDLGWTAPAKRSGAIRPRNRAWGGEGEKAIQDKANYDEDSEKCVEKWLTIEEFQARTKSSGPAADLVYVALAGGSKYAEREACEKSISQWRDQDSTEPKKGLFQKRATRSSFNEGEFLKSVKKGQTELGLGWASFVGVNTFFASCIAFPTNPAAKALEAVVDNLKTL